MKTFISIFSILTIFSLLNQGFGQTVTMSNATINQCSGNLLDPGGTNDYANNNNTTTTICPGIPGAAVRLNFTFFNTESIFDNLTIYDGNSNLAPVIGVFSGILGPFNIQATNVSGCLTLVFTSDANFTNLGFSAELSCALPCQAVIAQINSTNPAQVGGFIDVCIGSTLTVNGSGNFPSAAPVYPQSDATSTFLWNFGDLASTTTQTASHLYNTPGIFDLNLTVTDLNGCSSTNDINLKVRVSDIPIFAGTLALNNSICLGQANELSGIAISTEIQSFCESSDPQVVEIPDGIGVPYSSTLSLDCFSPGATITSAMDLSSVCLDIEHSYLHDLDISLTCPNGTTISLYSPMLGAVNSVQLGEPVDNDLSSTFGNPYSYCFNMSAGNNWFDVAEGIVGPVPTYNYADNDGSAIMNTMYLPAGDYLPTQSLANLIGCPLNGNWTITITDQLPSDNGVVFGISLDFNPTLFSTINNLTPALTTSWMPDPTISATIGNTITVIPTSIGTSCYVFQSTDQFGCQHDTTICFDVVPADDGTFSYAQTAYCTSDSDPTPVVAGTLGGIFSANNGLVINPLTGTIDLSTALPGTYIVSYATPGPGCPEVTTVPITINSATANFSATNLSGCAPLTVNFTNLSPSSVNCSWNFGDGFTSFACGSVSHIYTNDGLFSPQLTITDNNGCIAVFSQSNLIQVDAQPVADFTVNPESIPSYDQTVVLNNTTIGATNYLWVFSNHSSSTAHSPVLNLNLQDDETFLVKLYAYSSAGCVDSTQRNLNITPDLVFYVPNAFTPNHDEFNTYFKPIMTQGFKKDSYNFKIYDRWGNLLFHSKDILVGWDGTYQKSGKIAPDGIYIYHLDFLMNTGDERRSYEGHVNLLR